MNLKTNFYWFEWQDTYTLNTIAKELEKFGFFAILLPYTETSGDNFIRIAKTIEKDKAIKYMVAIRPYTISPQYLSGICSSLEEFAKERIMINFVVGSPSEIGKKETILGEITDISDHFAKREYLAKYVQIFKDINSHNTTKICISGGSKEVISVTESLADYGIIAYSKYLQDDFKMTKPKIISFSPVIVESHKETNSNNLISDVIFCTEDELESLILKIKNDGIDDIMFYIVDVLSFDKNDQKIKLMNFVKSFNEKYGGISG